MGRQALTNRLGQSRLRAIDQRSSGAIRSVGVVCSAWASSQRLTRVGLRRPRSRSLRYCCENPDRSANCSCVSPRASLIRFVFRPTSCRMSMAAIVAGQAEAVYQLFGVFFPCGSHQRCELKPPKRARTPSQAFRPACGCNHKPRPCWTDAVKSTNGAK